MEHRPVVRRKVHSTDHLLSGYPMSHRACHHQREGHRVKPIYPLLTIVILHRVLVLLTHQHQKRTGNNSCPHKDAVALQPAPNSVNRTQVKVQQVKAYTFGVHMDSVWTTVLDSSSRTESDGEEDDDRGESAMAQVFPKRGQTQEHPYRKPSNVKMYVFTLIKRDFWIPLLVSTWSYASPTRNIGRSTDLDYTLISYAANRASSLLFIDSFSLMLLWFSSLSRWKLLLTFGKHGEQWT
jgi:hypothetical protein